MDSPRSLSTEVVRFHQLGWKQVEIAQELGIHQTRVSKILRGLGISGYNFNFLQQLSDTQQSVLVGTLCGDASVVFGGKKCRYPYVSMVHCLTQRDWLRWKVEQLGSLFDTQLYVPYRNKTHENAWAVGATSKTHPLLSSYYQEFYSRPDADCSEHVLKKQITRTVLSKVDDLALAVWFQDDGSTVRNSLKSAGRDGLTLCLGGGTDDEYELVKDWLGEQGMCVSRMKASGNAAVLYFGVDVVPSLLKRIRRFIHPSMEYKLGSWV